MERVVGKVIEVVDKRTHIFFTSENATGSMVLKTGEHFERGDAVLITVKRGAGSMEVTKV